MSVHDSILSNLNKVDTGHLQLVDVKKHPEYKDCYTGVFNHQQVGEMKLFVEPNPHAKKDSKTSHIVRRISSKDGKAYKVGSAAFKKSDEGKERMSLYVDDSKDDKSKVITAFKSAENPNIWEFSNQINTLNSAS